MTSKNTNQISLSEINYPTTSTTFTLHQNNSAVLVYSGACTITV